MPPLEFVSQSGRDPANPQATAERLVNLFPQPMAAGARAALALKSVPGTQPFAALDGVFVRAMANATEYDEAGRPQDRLVAVNNGGLQRISAGGAVAELAAIPDDAETGLSTNGGAITVTAGGRYFVWDGTALTEPDPGEGFDTFGGVEFLSDYTILTERNDRRFRWSVLADAKTLPDLNFATAEARDDVLIRPVAIAGNLWLFKSTSIEIWGLTGLSGQNAFARVGPVIERGAGGYSLIAKIPGGAFFVGDDGIVYLTGGTTALQPISTPAVNAAIAAGGVTDCFYYEWQGQKFCVVRFRDRPALCFDIATGVWHERATGENGAWGATCAAYAYGAWRFGGYSGAVRTAIAAPRDGDAAMIRRAVSRPMDMGGRLFEVPLLAIKAATGNGGRVELRLSRNGGKTWGGWRSSSLGSVGAFGTRAVFRANGQARVLTAEIRMSGPESTPLWSAADVEVA